MKLSSYDNHLEYDDNYGSETVGRIVQTDEEILRMIKSEFGDHGVTRVVDLSFTKSSKYMYGGGYIRKPLRPNSKIPVEVRVDVDGGDDDWYLLELDVEISDSVSFLYTDLDDDYDEDDLTESKKKPKLVKEAYSEDLSKELQLFMTIKKTTQSDFVRKLATEAIEKIRTELKKPTDQPKTPVTESVRDRIRAKLRANRK